jgi:hypothetical protein
MKYKHNKKRNTAFIFEALVKELAKASLERDNFKKQNIVSTLKKYFSKGKILKKELEIYKSLAEGHDLDRQTMEKILLEAKKQFSVLDRKKVFEEQSKLISEVNNQVGTCVWDNFVSQYKKLATINQSLAQTAAPKKQVVLEEKLLNSLIQEVSQRSDNKFPKINNLAMKNFVEKFNEQYSDILNENQRILLSKYITSSGDQSLEFKAYLYEEVDKIKNFFAENKKNFSSDITLKIDGVLERVNSYNERKFDKNLVFEIFRVQSLVGELQKNGN